ncbi:hypothetical protein D5274_14350 [bacterium 1XD42-94]|nr:hypothetical protein [bacterium 1XD42-76]NBK06295.1 hypothetical protein [bacterium 1XD42-94]
MNFKECFYNIATQCLKEIPEFIRNSADASKIQNIKADNDPTTLADILAENIAYNQLKKLGDNIDFFSEERGYLLKSNHPQYLIQMDPIDGTFMALRQLPGACMAITAFLIEGMKPIEALVADYYNGDIYWANQMQSCLNDKKISPSKCTKLEQAFVSTCYGKRSRFSKILEDPRLANRTFWISTNGGILDMVRVATGQVDAYLDLMLGYKPYDFSAGAFIAQQAGAIVTDGEGNTLTYPSDPNVRCKFIIASTRELVDDILLYNDN